MIYMGYNFFIFFILFIFYSFFGWTIEVLLALFKEHKFINRGFLIGPIVPIWGTGAILITLLVKPSDSIFSLFTSAAFIGTFLEYVVNYLMELLFKARWWDYSHLPFNINGRIWLGSSIFFGIGGIIIMVINPYLLNWLYEIDKALLCVVSGVLLILLIIDLFVSCNIITKLKLSAYSLRKDYTEEITKKVKSVLFEKSRNFRRLLKAFPDVSFYFKGKK